MGIAPLIMWFSMWSMIATQIMSDDCESFCSSGVPTSINPNRGERYSSPHIWLAVRFAG